jgi:hypothetical protein
MKVLFRLVLVLASALWLPATSNAQQICNGKFPNLITDVCYDCIFPIGIMGGLLNLGVSGDDYDTGASKTPICVCVNNLGIGTPVSFWEPRYMVDTTTKPGCMPLLAGVDINTPYNAAEYGGFNTTNAHIGGRRKSAFMHVNEYINPVMSAIGAVVANPCLDNRSFDVPFLSWADPTWNDDALSLILTPYAYPFAGVASVAAELPDAIAATFSFPYATLFWVAGAWGQLAGAGVTPDDRPPVRQVACGGHSAVHRRPGGPGFVRGTRASTACDGQTSVQDESHLPIPRQPLHTHWSASCLPGDRRFASAGQGLWLLHLPAQGLLRNDVVGELRVHDETFNRTHYSGCPVAVRHCADATPGRDDSSLEHLHLRVDEDASSVAGRVGTRSKSGTGRHCAHRIWWH